MNEHISTGGTSPAGNCVATSDRSDIAAGIQQTLPVSMGFTLLGLALDLPIAQTGFSWWWAPIFSIAVYAGSMEFLIVGLVVAHTGLLGCTMTSFVVNSHHVFYGLTFPHDRIRSHLGHVYSIYAPTNELYFIASATGPDEKIPGRRLLTIQILC